MDYRGKKVAVTGGEGFLGSALVAALRGAGAEVNMLRADIRNEATFMLLDHTYSYLFHFAAPSSQVLFNRAPAPCIEATLKGFMNAAAIAKTHNIRLVYPSTGLLSQGKSNEYARCKQICEDWAKGNGMNAIGLRIFATYGPGEGHKADYASTPYLFTRDLVRDKSPVIFGDGKQVRDFIYIDDVVNAILTLAEECGDDVVDVGSGEQTSFNDIVDIASRIISNARAGKKSQRIVEPIYVDAPAGYVNDTLANPSRMLQFYKPKVSISDGIERLVKELMA